MTKQREISQLDCSGQQNFNAWTSLFEWYHVIIMS